MVSVCGTMLAPMSIAAGASDRRASIDPSAGGIRIGGVMRPGTAGLRHRMRRAAALKANGVGDASVTTSSVILSSHMARRGIARRGIPSRGVVRARAKPTSPQSSDDAESSEDSSAAVSVSTAEQEADDAAAAVEEKIRAQLEEIEANRERLQEIADRERAREASELERNAELESVGQIQAQLAIKAWEEHAKAVEFVSEAAEKVAEAYEAKAEAELTLSELKTKQSVLELAMKEAGGEDQAEAAGADAEEPVDEDTEDEKKQKKKEELAKMKKVGEWWSAEEPALTMDDAVTVIANRIAEAEAAVAKAVADIESREMFSAGVTKSTAEAEDLAKAADERAEDAMTLVAESMELALAARLAATTAEEEIMELAAKAAKIAGGDGLMSVDEEVEVQSEELAEDGGGVPAVAAAASVKQKEKEKSEDKETKSKKEQEEKGEEKKPEKPKVQTSSKQIASKFFSSDTDTPRASTVALGAGLAIGAGLFFGMMNPKGRQFISNTAASVTATVSKGQASLMQKIPESERKIAEHAMHEAYEAGLLDALTLLFTSICAVVFISKIPGGSPVLGFLLGGALVGPHTTGLVSHVGQAQILAEFGVVFLLFNIGLELSYERLQSMAKYIFGMGSAQMALTTMVGATLAVCCGMTVPAAVVIGMGLAFSSTAVALQVLQDRGETGGRHGRATFSVLLFQDLTVVLVFMLVPLLAGPDAGSITAIAASLAKAIVKTVVAIGAIMAVGRKIIRPIYNRIAKLGKAEVMTATTLFTALGTSLLTQSLGLSMALGAFLAGLLLAETEFHLQVESDIAPFRGLLLGLFFMTVGMQIDPACLVQNFGAICATAGVLLAYKMGVMVVCGKMFGLSLLTALRSGVYVAPGGEFAFVTFGLATAAGLLTMETVNIINLAVVLTMAGTPLLANIGSQLKNLVKQESSVASMQVADGDVDDLSGHVIIAGYGRVGRMIGQLLNKELIPFVALDVGAEEVSRGRADDLPVYFGDAGSATVLHAVGAEKASCAVVTMDSPAANYRAVWALHKYYPHIKVYVRAHDVEQGLQLEKAGAKAVVPETLEPALQLAAAVLNEMEMSTDEVSVAVDNFRRTHMGELQVLAGMSGSGLGYGQPTSMEQLKSQDQGEGGLIDTIVSA